MTAVDPVLLAAARDLVARYQWATPAFIQRRLPITTRREALALLDALETDGVVGPDPGGDQPRPVLVPPGT